MNELNRLEFMFRPEFMSRFFGPFHRYHHARLIIEMAVRSADLPEPPQPMPNGWAALLYLFGSR